jgi:hypothetical protein
MDASTVLALRAIKVNSLRDRQERAEPPPLTSEEFENYVLFVETMRIFEECADRVLSTDDAARVLVEKRRRRVPWWMRWLERFFNDVR